MRLFAGVVQRDPVANSRDVEEMFRSLPLKPFPHTQSLAIQQVWTSSDPSAGDIDVTIDAMRVLINDDGVLRLLNKTHSGNNTGLPICPQEDKEELPARCPSLTRLRTLEVMIAEFDGQNMFQTDISLPLESFAITRDALTNANFAGDSNVVPVVGQCKLDPPNVTVAIKNQRQRANSVHITLNGYIDRSVLYKVTEVTAKNLETPCNL
ncbi:hypothetical protein BC567DRAFT_300138 [Phyllosticta citribraziliensis]